MSIATMAMPGRIPVCGSGRNLRPEDLFKDESERDDYRRILDNGSGNVAPDIKINKVSVRIFDLSDEDQVREYEELWADLLKKTARMEVVVDSRKDLVKRSDGTSYWMKYVEYVEFGDASEKDEKGGSSRKGEQ